MDKAQHTRKPVRVHYTKGVHRSAFPKKKTFSKMHSVGKKISDVVLELSKKESTCRRAEQIRPLLFPYMYHLLIKWEIYMSCMHLYRVIIALVIIIGIVNTISTYAVRY